MKCKDSEIPFEVPPGWQWERLGNISTIARVGSPRPIEKFIMKNHDGWLVIGNIASVFYQDFLYYALSSDFMYQSLSILAVGLTVKNLKSESVKSVLFPNLPKSEQIQIVNKLILIMNNLKIAETALT